MQNQIIQQLSQTLASILPDVKSKVKTLQDFTIFSGATLKVKAPPALKSLVDSSSWYITMKFDGTATREDAKRAFQYAMEEKLGLPKTGQSIDDEILPKNDFQQSSAPQLAGPTPDNGDVIDIDDNGNVKNTIAKTNPLVASPVSKYYAVEFKILDMPHQPPKYLGSPAGKLGSSSNGMLKCWAPPHQLSMHH